MIDTDLLYRDDEGHEWPIETTVPLAALPRQGETLWLESANDEFHRFVIPPTRFIVREVSYAITIRATDKLTGSTEVRRSATICLDPGDEAAKEIVARLQAEQGKHWGEADTKATSDGEESVRLLREAAAGLQRISAEGAEARAEGAEALQWIIDKASVPRALEETSEERGDSNEQATDTPIGSEKKQMADKQLVNEDNQAIQCASEQAPADMIATPVEVTGARLHKKMNVTGEDLVVHGRRWYVEVDLRNINVDSDEFGTEAIALYRVWREADQLKAIRVELWDKGE